MPDPGIYAFSIRKSISWRGRTQEFSNLYHYYFSAPTTTGLENTLDYLKDAERPIHDGVVTFQEGRAWGPLNAQGRGGNMEAVRSWSQAGTKTSGTAFYKECAYLVIWPLGRYGSRNRPQFLRKWIHSQSTGLAASADTTGNAALGGATSILNTYITAVTTATVTGVSGSITLQTAKGNVPISGGVLYGFLEHRQYG